MSQESEILFCGGCGKIPFIYLKQVAPLQYQVICHKCQTEWIILGKELFSHSETDISKFGCCFKTGHESKKNGYYCKKCNIQYCSNDDHPIHQNHKNEIVVISTLPKKEYFQKKIEEAKEYLKKLTQDIDKKIEGYTTNEKKELQEKKNLYILTNEKGLLEVAKKLLKFNYEPNNYISICNLIESTTFQFVSFDFENKSSKEFCDSLKNFSIGKGGYIKQKYPYPKIEFQVRNTFRHDDQVRTICMMSNNLVISGSWDKKFGCFSLENEGGVHASIPPAESDIPEICCCVALNSKTAVVGFADGDIGLYEREDENFKKVLKEKAHEKCVSKLVVISENTICSSSYDCFIKIWEIKNKYIKCKRVFEGHTGEVTSIIKLKNSKRIVSASNSLREGGDGTLRVWNIESTDCFCASNKIKCCSPHSLIEFKSNVVLVGNIDLKILVIDIEKKEIKKRIRFPGSPWCFLLYDEFVLVGDNNGELRALSEIERENPVVTAIFKVHNSGITDMIKIKNNKILTCSADNSVKVLEQKPKEKEKREKTVS